MILKPCPFCQKDIPRSITACPYCHRDEKGQTVQMDTTVTAAEADHFFENDLKELASADLFVRNQAVVRVAQRGFGVVQALISILGDFAKPGLAGVAKALGQIRDKRAIPVLAQAAKMGDDDLRTAAVWALTQFHEPEVIPILLSEVERPHPLIQSYVANALGAIQDPRVLPALSKLALHPHREVAFQAAYALGEMGNPQAISALRRAARRRDPFVRAAASASLRRLGSSVLKRSTWWIWIIGVFLAAGVIAAFLHYK